jgi:hypothetical protein
MRGVARPSHVRAIAAAALAALTIAGCGASRTVAPTTPHFVLCQLEPETTQGLFLVPGGFLGALSVEGTTCQHGIGLMTTVIGGLDAGQGADSHPERVAGWSCLSYDGNETACFRGERTLYAQYGLSRHRKQPPVGVGT